MNQQRAKVDVALFGDAPEAATLAAGVLPRRQSQPGRKAPGRTETLDTPDVSDSERLERQKEWRPYEDGYWQNLLAEAAARFRAEFGALPHVVDFNHGVYHGGTLILGVVTDLPVSQRVEIPSYYLGFPVLQFHKGSVPSERANV